MGKRAFSIGELVVATGLLAMMVVTMMVLFGQMLTTTTKNAMMSQGSFFADAVIEREITRLHSTHVTMGVPVYSSDWITFSDESNKTTFLYRLDSSDLSLVTNAAPAEPLPGTPFLVQVEVRWWQSDMNSATQNRANYGKLYLKRNRVVYVHR